MGSRYAEVVRFNNAKGYGFAQLEHSTDGRHVLIHHSEFDAEGYVAVYPGDRLVLDVYENGDKLCGRHIRRRSFT